MRNEPLINGLCWVLGRNGDLSGDLDMNRQVQSTNINNLLNPKTDKGKQFAKQNPSKIEKVR